MANSNTVGHKKDQISFSDVLYNQAGFGKGVQTQSISKQFEQGNIVQSGVGIDVAIEGKGFFVVKDADGNEVSDHKYVANGKSTVVVADEIVSMPFSSITKIF